MSPLPSTPAQTRVSWIGTGVMGASMAGHLLSAGYAVCVYNRTRAKAEPLIARGATWAESPAAAAADAHIICSMVGFPADVREVLLGDEGAISHSQPGTILIDFTTSDPTLAEEVARAAVARGLFALDAPVSGGDIGARNAALSIMVGGDESTFDAVLPLLQTLGKTIVHQGPAGSGQHTKLTNQILVASQMIGVCEALLYAYRAGLNLETVLQSVSPGAAGSWSLSNLGPRMIANNFAPGFYVDHFVKDLGLALAESRRMRLSLPGTALAEQLYLAVQAQGDGRLGTHALLRALAALSGISWEARMNSRTASISSPS